MSSSGQSVSYLDLGGNFVVWAGDGNTISLYGSHFHQVLLVLPLVISGLCLVAFLAIVTWLAYVYLSHKPSRRFLKWYGAGLSSLSMTCYFALDLANRIFHELELNLPTTYVAIDIATDKVASLGELLLLFALLRHCSPALQDNITAGTRFAFLVVGDIGTVTLVILFNVVGGVLSIYNFVANNLGPPDPSQYDSSDNTVSKVLGSYPAVNATQYAIYLVGAISFAIQCVLVVRELHKADTFHDAPRFTILLLATAFLIRSVVSFIFVMVFGLHGRWATYTEQLIHMVFYGPLSVTIYASIVRIAAMDEYGVATATYAPVEQVVSKEWVGWQQNKPHGSFFANDIPPVPAYSTTYHLRSGSD